MNAEHHSISLAEAGLRDTLILMACGGKKAETAGQPVPLVELYQGPMWSTLRKRLGGAEQLRSSGAHVVVLSGGLGVIPALWLAAPYEVRLTRERADALMAVGIQGKDWRGTTVLSSLFPRDRDPAARPWRAVIAAGGSDYRRVFLRWAEELRSMHYLCADAPVYATTGGIGEQRSQLGQWIDQLVGKDA